MAGNIFQDLFQGQMDYIFFFRGLAFMLVLAVSCLYRGDTSQRLPWRWFGLFALAQGLASWLSLVAMNFGGSAVMNIIASLLHLASWGFLAEFGRSGLGRVRGRESGVWLIALLLMLTGLAGLKGWSGIELTSRYTLGLVGGLWAATALFMAGRNLPYRERGGSLTAGISLTLFAFSVALFPPGYLVSPGSLFNQGALLQLIGVPLEFFQALLAFGMAAGIYSFLPGRQKATGSQETRHRSRYMFVLLAVLSIILGLGSVVTLYLGEWAHQRQERVKAEAQEYATIVVSRFNTEFKRMEDGVTALSEVGWLPAAMRNLSEDNLDKINALLDRSQSTLGASVCYLMDKNGKTIASSNRSAPDSFVGQSYAFRPYFKQAFMGKTGRYFAVGVTSKAPGYYVSRPVRAPNGRTLSGVAVIKVSLQNITNELQAAGQKGNSLICLADPRGVVFLASQPSLIFKSLWPVAEKDLTDLQHQYGKDQFPAIFPAKIDDGAKLDYQGANYMSSFAGTIHAGWSVYIFRPIERVGVYRLGGIAVACLLAVLALVILGSNFYFRERALASSSRFRAMFDAAPEAIGVIDPDTLQFVEANQPLAACLGFTRKELLNVKLGMVINQKPHEIHDQLLKIIRDDETTKMDWRARRKEGDIVDLVVMGSKVVQQGKDQVLIFCRETETLPQATGAILQQSAQPSPVQKTGGQSLPAGNKTDASQDAGTEIFPNLLAERPNGEETNIDQEGKQIIQRIMFALNKAEKLRKDSENQQKL
jgi:PAS domain S-box-containing protein